MVNVASAALCDVPAEDPVPVGELDVVLPIPLIPLCELLAGVSELEPQADTASAEARAAGRARLRMMRLVRTVRFIGWSLSIVGEWCLRGMRQLAQSAFQERTRRAIAAEASLTLS